MTGTSPGTLSGIQYLRAAAAIAVVLFHAAEKTGYHFAIGAAGVDVFFVISGFIMWVVSARREPTPSQFLRARIRRIVPVYWLATFLMVAGALAGLFPNLVLTAGHVAASLFFVPMRSPSSGEIWPVLVQGWTLAYEMFFYAIFAACLPLPARLRLAAVAATFLLLVTLGFLVESDNALFVTYTRPIILEFVAGMLIARLRISRGHLPHAGLVLALGVILFLLPILGTPVAPRCLYLGIPSVMIVLGAVFLPQVKSRIGDYFGAASYSIYLGQVFALPAANMVVKNLMPGAGYDLKVLAMAAISVALGCLLYSVIERPMTRWLRGRSRRADRVPATG